MFDAKTNAIHRIFNPKISRGMDLQEFTAKTGTWWPKQQIPRLEFSLGMHLQAPSPAPPHSTSPQEFPQLLRGTSEDFGVDFGLVHPHEFTGALWMLLGQSLNESWKLEPSCLITLTELPHARMQLPLEAPEGINPDLFQLQSMEKPHSCCRRWCPHYLHPWRGGEQRRSVGFN